MLVSGVAALNDQSKEAHPVGSLPSATDAQNGNLLCWSLRTATTLTSPLAI